MSYNQYVGEQYTDEQYNTYSDYDYPSMCDPYAAEFSYEYANNILDDDTEEDEYDIVLQLQERDIENRRSKIQKDNESFERLISNIQKEITLRKKKGLNCDKIFTRLGTVKEKLRCSKLAEKMLPSN